MIPLPIEIATDGGILPGEAHVADTPVLRGHAGTQPDLFLRWNEIPATAEAVDVVVHLHGFSQQGAAMPLSEKVGRSGLDLSGRTRPTLALLPRGNWIRHYYYDFPALLDGGLDRLIGDALHRLPRSFALGRLIASAHSGGVMPLVDALAGMTQPPDELHLFDGLYGRDPQHGDPLHGLGTIATWLADRLAAEPTRPGALRVVYIERQTGPFSRAVGDLVAGRLAALPPGIAKAAQPRYRVERSGVPHAYVAAICGPLLLADAGAAIDWSRI